VFFFDRVSSAILAMAEVFRKEGTLIYFEPSGIGRVADFRKALDLSHIVKYSRDRLHSSLAAVGGLCRLASRRPRVEIETRGADGLRYRINTGRKNGWRWRRQDAFEVTRLRDAAGAGDWCSAGTLLQLGWTRGGEETQLSVDALHHALTFGQALAALSCQHLGPRSIAHVFGRRDVIASAFTVQKDGLAGVAASKAGPVKPRLLAKRKDSECHVCLTA
jgi:fructokinase